MEPFDTPATQIIRMAAAKKTMRYRILAREVDLDPSLFSRIIRGERPMPPEVKHKLAKILGIAELVAEVEQDGD